jgi:hypothetical protein
VLLSHRLWDGRFGSDAAILGREILLDGEGHTVIGVLQKGGPSMSCQYGELGPDRVASSRGTAAAYGPSAASWTAKFDRRTVIRLECVAADQGHWSGLIRHESKPEDHRIHRSEC